MRKLGTTPSVLCPTWPYSLMRGSKDEVFGGIRLQLQYLGTTTCQELNQNVTLNSVLFSWVSFLVLFSVYKSLYMWSCCVSSRRQKRRVRPWELRVLGMRDDPAIPAETPLRHPSNSMLLIFMSEKQCEEYPCGIHAECMLWAIWQNRIWQKQEERLLGILLLVIWQFGGLWCSKLLSALCLGIAPCSSHGAIWCWGSNRVSHM